MADRKQLYHSVFSISHDPLSSDSKLKTFAIIVLVNKIRSSYRKEKQQFHWSFGTFSALDQIKCLFIITNLPAVEGRFIVIVAVVAAVAALGSITNWLQLLIGRLIEFESKIRSDDNEPLSFDISLIKLELHSVKLPPAPHTIGSSKPNPSKISSDGNAIFTFCR